MKRIAKKAVVATLLGLAGIAHAADKLDLSRYQLTGNYALPALGELGLEASAVTFARDRNSLFVVGDEGLGVIELSRTGTVLGTMNFDWTGTGSSNNDAEGLTYLGGGQLAVVDERPQIVYRFSFANGGTVVLNNQAKAHVGSTAGSVGNVGTEGISVDPRDGTFFTVKQDNPLELRSGTIDFANGTASMTTLFSGQSSLFGLASFSDIQTLAPIDALAGTAAADNLLILSLDSRKLVELDRAGNVLSQFDLAGVTPQAIEGVTVDHLGVIYLVAEDTGTPNSRLFVLTPVPEPETYGLLMAGLGCLAWRLRRRQA